MGKFYDADGNEVEAFSTDELKTHPEVAKLQQDLLEAQNKIKESENGGMNENQKKRLKQDAEDAKTALETFKKETEEKFSSLQNNLTSTIKGKALATLSKGNKDASEKIDLKFQSLMKTGEYTNDETGITKAMADAATLVNGARPAPSFLNNLTGAGDRGDGGKIPGADGSTESEGAKAMRGPLGITDADIKKYEGKIK